MLPNVSNLTLSNSKDLNVDGSTSSKVFSYSPGIGNSVELHKIICVFRDEGTTSLNKFGAITALTNGVLLQITQNSETRTITTIKDNADLITRFFWNQFGNGAILSILGVVTPEGFGASNNIFIGVMDFHKPVIIADNDTITAVVQDNLTNIDSFQIAVKYSQD